MSNLQNESLLETFYEEALEEMGINKDSLFYADACKIAEQMAMDRLLSFASTTSKENLLNEILIDYLALIDDDRLSELEDIIANQFEAN